MVVSKEVLLFFIFSFDPCVELGVGYYIDTLYSDTLTLDDIVRMFFLMCGMILLIVYRVLNLQLYGHLYVLVFSYTSGHCIVGLIHDCALFWLFFNC